MTDPLPNDAVSAYFDGELSPSEREAIARQISQSAAAQSELAEIRRLSEELRHLPRESAPKDLRSAVIGSRLSRDGAPRPASVGSSSMFFIAKWLSAAAALAVLVSWLPSFWKTSEPTDSSSTMASKSQTMTAEVLKEPSPAIDLPGERASGPPQRLSLGSEGEMLAQKENRRPFAANENRAGFGVNPEPNAASPLDAQMRPSIAGAALADSVSPPEKALPADPQVEQVLDFANRQNDGVVIVEITAENPRQTLAQLQQSLAQNSISPANFQLSPQRPEAEDGRNLAKDAAGDSLYVQSSREQLSAVLTQLRRQNSISEIQAQTTLALNNIPVLEDENNSPGDEANGSRYRRSLAQSIEQYESGQAGQSFGGARSASKKGPGSESDKDQKNHRDLKLDEAKPAAPGIASSDLGSLQKQAAMQKLAKAPDEAKSFQMLVQTPANVLSKKRLDKAETPPQESKPDDPVAKPEQAAIAEAKLTRQGAVAEPVRLMFIFRERRPPAPPKK